MLLRRSIKGIATGIVLAPLLLGNSAFAQGYGQDNRDSYGQNNQGNNQVIYNCNSPGSCGHAPSAPQQQNRGGGNSTRLGFSDCATVLEAVKTCENIESCSSSSMQDHFTDNQLEFFNSINGNVFSVSAFFDQCDRTCRAGSYTLQPTRRVLCGY